MMTSSISLHLYCVVLAEGCGFFLEQLPEVESIAATPLAVMKFKIVRVSEVQGASKP